MEVDRDVLVRYADTFIPRWDRYPLQLPDGKYVAIKKPFTLDLVEKHIRGEVTIGAYALDRSSRAKWLCLDADDDTEWDGLLDMARQLHDQDLSPYLEPSRRGGHLWLFLDRPIPGQDARRFGKWLLAKHDLPDVELFPKQDELRTGPGSLVRLPLGVHRKSGKRYHFVTLGGNPLAPTVRDQMAVLSHPATIPYTVIENVLADLPEPKPVFPTPRFSKRKLAGAEPSERIKRAVSVYDFVSQYVDLDRNGRGLCPFHDDHRQSFSVDRRGNYWRCFAGCEGNTVIDFWMKWRELHGQDSSFTATVTELAQMLL